MASRTSNLRVTIDANASRFEREVLRAQRSLSQLEKEIHRGNQTADKFDAQLGRSSGTIINKLGPAIAGMAAGMVSFDKVLRSGFERLTNIEDADKRFRQMGLSVGQVDRLMAGLNDTVQGTAFRLDDGASVMATFISSGMDVDQVNKRLEMLADTAAFAQAPLTEIGHIFERIQTEGKLTGETLRMLQVRGVPALDLLASAAGVSGEAMREMISEGAVDTERFFQLWETGAAGFGDNAIKIEGAAKSMGDTTRGALANAETALARLGAEILERFMPTIRSMADGTKDVVDQLIGFSDGLDVANSKIEETIKNVAGEGLGDALLSTENNLNTVTLGLYGVVTGLKDLVFGSDEATEKTGWLATEADRVRGVIEEYIPAIDDGADALSGHAAQAEVAAENLAAYLEQVKLATDPVYALNSAVADVEKAQTAFNDAVEKHGPKSKEAQDAAITLMQKIGNLEAAALDGELSFEQFESKLADWVAQGIITKAEADAIRKRVKTLRDQAEKYKGNYNAKFTETGIEAVRQKIKNLESAILKLPSGKTIRIAAEASVGSFTGAGVFRAAGGAITGPGTGTSDSIPAWLSTGEHVWTAREVQNAGGHGAVEAMRSQFRFARGGPVDAAKVRVVGDVSDWKDSEIPNAINAAVTKAGQMASAAAAPGKVLPPGTYRIGRGPAAHGYNARDLPAPTGTPIFAAAAGIVSKALRLATSYGIHAAISHGNWRTLYAHMSQMFVRPGQSVARGQMIGRVGSTGNSTGPHLHLEPDNARLYDRGGIWPSGTWGYNGSGGAELVLPPASGGRGGPDPDIARLGKLLGAAFLKAVAGERDKINQLFGTPKPRTPLFEQIREIDNKDRRRRIMAMAQNTRRELMGWAKELERVNSRLDKARDKLRGLRSDAKQLRRQIREQVADVDIAGASRTELNRFGVAFERTNLASITAQLRKQRNDARRFADVIESLRRRGLNDRTMQQLIEAGPEQGLAAAQAILSGGRAGIEQVNTLQRQLARAGNRIGQTAADSMYKAGIRAAEGLVRGLEREETRIERTMVRIASTMVSAIKRQLGIRSPSRVFAGLGHDTARGLALGLMAGNRLVERSAAELAKTASVSAYGHLVSQQARQFDRPAALGIGAQMMELRVALVGRPGGTDRGTASLINSLINRGDLQLEVVDGRVKPR